MSGAEALANICPPLQHLLEIISPVFTAMAPDFGHRPQELAKSKMAYNGGSGSVAMTSLAKCMPGDFSREGARLQSWPRRVFFSFQSAAQSFNEL